MHTYVQAIVFLCLLVGLVFKGCLPYSCIACMYVCMYVHVGRQRVNSDGSGFVYLTATHLFHASLEYRTFTVL